MQFLAALSLDTRMASVLPLDRIASELARIVRHPFVAVPPVAKADVPLPGSDEELNKIFVLVRSATGVDFSLYKPTHLNLDNKIDGVVLAFVEIDTGHRVRDARDFAEAIVEAAVEPLLVLDGDLRVKVANRAYYEMFQARPEETENRFIYNLVHPRWNLGKLRELLEKVLPTDSHFEKFEVDVVLPKGEERKLVVNGRRIVNEGGTAQWILLGMEPGR